MALLPLPPLCSGLQVTAFELGGDLIKPETAQNLLRLVAGAYMATDRARQPPRA